HADEGDDAEGGQHREQHQREYRVGDRPRRYASHGALTAAPALPATTLFLPLSPELPEATAVGATLTCSPVRRNAPATATTRSFPLRPLSTSSPCGRAPTTLIERRSTRSFA